MADGGHSTHSAEPPEWETYGKALLHSMADVRAEVPEELHALLMETADYWLTVGLVIGTQHRDAAQRLIELAEKDEHEREELAADAQHFVAEALDEA
ncbi:MAG: hypothetical protein JOY68_02985 [Candidatus Dormibacteraeota bacterium]|nr:hypothetical protein [Candidatus Dormibacteraeota bacterium]